jgi:Tol biopolymer transport system component
MAADVRLPSTLDSGSAFQPLVEDMWRLSPTFRRQCARLAIEPLLTIRLSTADNRTDMSFADAKTLVHRKGAHITAEVYLPVSQRTVELIAHEVEHIVEQLDGVDLNTQAGSGAAWRTPSGAFETARAVETGRRVAHEVQRGAAKTGRDKVSTSVAGDAWHASIALQDRHSRPVDGRSARVSGNGRYVAFSSYAQLVAADRNSLRDVYVVDLLTGEFTLESRGVDGGAGGGDSVAPDISADGRYVTFESAAANLIAGRPPSEVSRVVVRDRHEGTLRDLVPAGAETATLIASRNPVISADGRAIAYESFGDTPSGSSIQVVRPLEDVRVAIDVTSAGARRPGKSVTPSISGNGRYVAFMSTADLTCGHASGCSGEPADRNGIADVYLRDTHAQVTTRISRSPEGHDSDGPSYAPSISSDGRFVVFVSEATNLGGKTKKRMPQIYVHDVATGTIELVSHTPRGRPANGPSTRPVVSRDGSIVAFQSLASDLLCDANCEGPARDINLVWDVFVYSRAERRAVRISAGTVDEWMEHSRTPTLDDHGRVVVFGTRHPIDPRDEAFDEDLFVWVRK